MLFKTTKVCLTLVAALLLGAFHTSEAIATVIWDESIDGDLGTLGPNVGVLSLGNNTFLGSGSITRLPGGAATADTDSGFFDLSEGLRIILMTARITSLYESEGSTLNSRSAGLRDPEGTDIFVTDMVSETISVDLLFSDTIGTYRFFTGGGSASGGDDLEILWDWKINIVVAKVPEPSAILLVGTGLIALIGMTRRKAKY